METNSPSQILATLYKQALAILVLPSLHEQVLPDHYATLQGSLRGQAIALHTRRFVGGVWRSLTVATIAKQPSGDLVSLTIVGLPTSSSLLPIVGVDLIALQGTLSLIAIDLSPTDLQVYEEQATPILQSLLHRAQPVTVARKRPDFCHDTFSPLALICASRPGSEPQVGQTIAMFLRQVAMLTESHVSDVPDESRRQKSWQQQRSWLRSEQENRKEANALSLMFGEEIAARYLQQFLFEVPHE